MKIRITLSAILMSFTLVTTLAASEAPEVDWVQLAKTWEEYLNYPSSDNAKRVYELLPDSGHVRYTYSEAESLALDSFEKNLPMLAYQVHAGDPEAVHLGFRLFTIADGIVAEELDILLGRLTRINPRLFLEGLNAHRHLISDYRVGHLVLNSGWEYVERRNASLLEVELRIASLQAVSNPGLMEVRNECLQELEDERSRLEKPFEER